jgi:diguanylate cyclase (GGDEF)-like protein
VGVTDITKFKNVEDELTKHASIDMQTHVGNRRIGMETIQNALLLSEKEHLEFTVCFIDINNLNEVNDNFCHDEGDHLINTICQVINSGIEKEDVLFRYGGDEFVVVFFQKQRVEVDKIWDKIVSVFNAMNQVNVKPYSISVSHGLFDYKSGMDVSLKEIIAFADKEMYKEKSQIKSAHVASLTIRKTRVPFYRNLCFYLIGASIKSWVTSNERVCLRLALCVASQNSTL